MASKRAANALSFAEKKALLADYDRLPPKTSQRKASIQLKIPQSTLKGLLPRGFSNYTLMYDFEAAINDVIAFKVTQSHLDKFFLKVSK